MKSLLKIVAVGTVLTIATVAIPTATYAGERDRGRDDRGWATVGRVLTGVAAVDLVAGILHGTEHHVAVAVEHIPLPPPLPLVCVPVPQPVVTGYWTTVIDLPQYGWVWNGYRRDYVIVRPSCARRIWVAGHYDGGHGYYHR